MLAGVRSRYSQAGRKLAKSTIVANIVDVIRQEGGHFLKFEKGAWFEVGDYCAREKVSAFSETLALPIIRQGQELPSEGCREKNRNAIRTHQYDLLVLNMNRTSCRHGRKAARFLGFDRSMELDFFK
jgi:hypothetical protein